MPARPLGSNEPPVSVVVPTYDRAHTLPRALESILTQTAPSDEVVVVDDGSTDHTREVVAEFGGRVRYLRIAHGGAGAARNAGVEAASHPWIAFLDSDDMWLEGKLEVQRAAVRHVPEAVLCFAEYEGRTRAGARHPARMRAGGWHPSRLGPAEVLVEDGLRFTVHRGSAFDMLFETGPLLQIDTVLARRADLLACPFPADRALYEEDEVFGRLARRGPFLYVDRVVSVLRAHDGPRLSDVLGGPAAEASWLAVLEEVWGGDPDFQARRGVAYRERIRTLRTRHVRSLLVRGESLAARTQLDRMATPPLGLRLLATLPRGLLQVLLRIRGMARGAWRRAFRR